MRYDEFCAAIGLNPATPGWKEQYQRAEQDGELTRPLFTDRLDALFPTFHSEVREAADCIAKQTPWLPYVNFLRVCYFAPVESPFTEPQRGDVCRNFAPVFALLSFFAETERRMLERGLPEPVRNRILLTCERMLENHRQLTGFPAVRRMLYLWARHYLVPDIFKLGSLEFEIAKIPAAETVFRKKHSVETVSLRNATETEAGWSGTCVFTRGGNESPVFLSKAEFEKWLEPGADFLSIHIPKKAKIDPDSFADARQKALEFFTEYYPECKFRAFHCHSWLMDPALSEFLPETSNIVTFQKFFHRYPVKSNGQEVFAFVHPTPFERYEELPETTTLERALKSRYLQNNPIYVHAGFRALEKEFSEQKERNKE